MSFKVGDRVVYPHHGAAIIKKKEKIDALIQSKQGMAREVLAAGGEALLTEMGDAELLRAVSLDLDAALDAA